MFIYHSVLSFAKKIVRFWNCVLSQIAFARLMVSGDKLKSTKKVARLPLPFYLYLKSNLFVLLDCFL